MKDGLALPTKSQCILIMDLGCDQSIVNSKAFSVGTPLNKYIHLHGALQGGRMESSKPLQLVNNACSVATLPDGSEVIIQINQAILDTHEDQTEALLQPHQCRSFGVSIHDVANCHIDNNGNIGQQCIITKDSAALPLFWDGFKTFLSLCKPTANDLDSLPIYVLTSPKPYAPQSSTSCRIKSSFQTTSVEEWRKRLGYPTHEATKRTLQGTTQ